MSLSHHIDAQTVIDHWQCNTHMHLSWSRDEDVAGAPKCTMPKVGIPSSAAYQLLHDECALDDNPFLNLASFAHLWMPPDAEKLIMENINKNIVDSDAYPAASAIHNRCILMIADLWKAPSPKEGKVIGTATAGSSEAIMLGGLAMKKRWQEARKAAGKDHYHPNIVFGSNAQVAFEKFARYFDVETRLVPVKASNGFIMDPHDALPFVDENTIGIIVILGCMYNGHFENVLLMNDLLDDLQKRTGLNIPIHVDGTSGAFIAPFAYPHLKWSFDVPRVVSINTSGHRFSLVYPGLGWVLWRDESYLHKELIFELHYLGNTDYTFTLNFSKPAAPVFAQMFNFISLGFEGYKKIAYKDLRNARLLSRALEKTYFTVLSDVHRPIEATRSNGSNDIDNPEHYEAGLPVVAFKLSDGYMKENPQVKQVWIKTMLKTKGWIFHNYNAPIGSEDVEILRVVIRETLSEYLIERFIIDIIEFTEKLATTDGSLNFNKLCSRCSPLQQ